MSKKSLSSKQIENLQLLNERQKAKKEARRHKICAWCSTPFKDTSNRLSQRTCSPKCSREWGVAKRKEKGSYVRTKEQNEKMAVSLQKARKEGRWEISEEAKKRLSNGMKVRWKNGNMAAATKKTNLEKHGVEHHMKTDFHRIRNSQLHKNRIVSVETRKKLSLHAQKQTHRFSRCRGGFREDLQQYFRSTWEANYARILNYENIEWEYESESFDLGNGSTYTPDFKINSNYFIEIKGWLTKKSKNKIKQFKLIYPDVKLILIQRDEYRELYQKYKDIIPNWEKVST